LKNKIVIGSRGSELALWQTNFVKKWLENLFPAQKFEIKIIQTIGDKILDSALSKIGDKGLFTSQIENALLEGEIDLAVHSLKDLQTVQPVGLKIGAITARELPNDVFISTKFSSIDDLPNNAKVATGSLRRRCQLLNRRGDLQILEIRGNVPTRIEKFVKSEIDGLILAYAGVHRLQLDKYIKQILAFDVMLPAVGQGALAIEIRDGDAQIEAMVKTLNAAETADCTMSERSFLRTLDGGCQVPIAGLAQINGAEIYLVGLTGSLDGKTIIRDSVKGNRGDAVGLGKRLGEKLLEKGAGELLAQARKNLENAEQAVIL